MQFNPGVNVGIIFSSCSITAYPLLLDIVRSSKKKNDWNYFIGTSEGKKDTQVYHINMFNSIMTEMQFLVPSKVNSILQPLKGTQTVHFSSSFYIINVNDKS